MPGSSWRSWRWAGSGSSRWRAASGGCRRRSGSAPSFATIGGVEVGQRVRVQGIDAGVVEAIEPPSAPGKPVTLVFRVDARLRPLVRRDATARIVDRGGRRRQGRRDRSGPARRPAAGRLGGDRRRAADRGGRPARARPPPRSAESTRSRWPPSAGWARSTPSPRRSARGRGASASSSTTTRRTASSSRCRTGASGRSTTSRRTWPR